MRLLRSVTLFCLTLFITTVYVEAQLRINRSDAETRLTSGILTVFDMEDTQGKVFNLGNIGDGNTWDISMYQYSMTENERVAVVPGETPYVENFPEASHALLEKDILAEEVDERYSYYMLNDDGLYFLGLVDIKQGEAHPLVNIPPIPQYLFPLEVGSTWDYSGDPIETSGGLIIQTEISVEAISSGTLKTAYASGEALCVKNVTRITEKLEFDGQVIYSSYSTSVHYFFLTKNGISATLVADTLDADSMTPSINMLSFTIEGSVNQVSDYETANTFAVEAAWPNPAQSGSMVNVSWLQNSAADVRISLYDMLGRELRTVFEGHSPAGTHTLTIPTNNLPAGLYMLRGHTAGSRDGMQRITLIR